MLKLTSIEWLFEMLFISNGNTKILKCIKYKCMRDEKLDIRHYTNPSGQGGVSRPNALIYGTIWAIYWEWLSPVVDWNVLMTMMMIRCNVGVGSIFLA